MRTVLYIYWAFIYNICTEHTLWFLSLFAAECRDALKSFESLVSLLQNIYRYRKVHQMTDWYNQLNYFFGYNPTEMFQRVSCEMKELHSVTHLSSFLFGFTSTSRLVMTYLLICFVTSESASLVAITNAAIDNNAKSRYSSCRMCKGKEHKHVNVPVTSGYHLDMFRKKVSAFSPLYITPNMQSFKPSLHRYQQYK